MSLRNDLPKFLQTKSRGQKIALFGWGFVGLVMTTTWPLLGRDWDFITCNGIGIVLSTLLILTLSFLDWKSQQH
jgi:hypothetical protein